MSTNHAYNETLLLSMMVRGDRDAFAQLYRMYLDAVRKYIYLFTHSTEETEEIVQDVFVRIWEQREKLSGVSSFKAYVLRAAKNKLLDYLRHRDVRKAAVYELQYRGDLQQAETPEDVWEYKDFYRKVQKIVASLPTQCQHIFRLSIEKGLSLDEIAAQLHISKSGVKNQLHKAQRIVRQHLDEPDKALLLLVITTMLAQFPG